MSFLSVCSPARLLSVSTSLSVPFCLFASASSMSLLLYLSPLSLSLSLWLTPQSLPHLLSSLSFPLCLFLSAFLSPLVCSPPTSLFSLSICLPLAFPFPYLMPPPSPSCLSLLLHVPLCLFPYVCSPLSLYLRLSSNVSHLCFFPHLSSLSLPLYLFLSVCLPPSLLSVSSSQSLSLLSLPLCLYLSVSCMSLPSVSFPRWPGSSPPFLLSVSDYETDYYIYIWYFISYSWPLLFPLPSGFGLWNRVSNVGGRKMREFSLFSFTLGAFAFFALFLHRVLFWLRARQCEKSASAHLCSW